LSRSVSTFLGGLGILLPSDHENDRAERGDHERDCKDGDQSQWRQLLARGQPPADDAQAYQRPEDSDVGGATMRQQGHQDAHQ